MLNGRNVKSDNFEATDFHEREKDFLNEAELEKLFESAKKSRHGLRDQLIFLMMCIAMVFVLAKPSASE